MVSEQEIQEGMARLSDDEVRRILEKGAVRARVESEGNLK